MVVIIYELLQCTLYKYEGCDFLSGRFIISMQLLHTLNRKWTIKRTYFWPVKQRWNRTYCKQLKRKRLLLAKGDKNPRESGKKDGCMKWMGRKSPAIMCEGHVMSGPLHSVCYTEPCQLLFRSYVDQLEYCQESSILRDPQTMFLQLEDVFWWGWKWKKSDSWLQMSGELHCP